MPSVLIADDDVELCLVLAEYLSANGLEVRTVHNAQAALAAFQGGSTRPDILVLDVTMPDMDGLTALRQLREREAVPVMMLSGRGAATDRVLGLELGADDYLAKPCLPRELLARLHALLRRSLPRSEESLVLGALRVDLALRKVWLVDIELTLTGAEFAVLVELLRQTGRLVSREQLTERALNRPLEKYDRAIDVHISRLRRKLEVRPTSLRIEGIRGAGYQLLATVS